MQLAKMLERLSKVERQELLRRRSIPPTVQDNRDLAYRLAMPQSIANALLELNAFQHLVLRWLCARPDLDAPWKTLVEELGDRVSTEYVTAQLREMRLWGLADFDPGPGPGFVATYPSVAQTYPKRALLLRDILDRMNSDFIRDAIRAWGVPPANIPLRKDKRLALAVSSLRDRVFLTSLLERLSPEARDLFQWVRDRGGSVPSRELMQRVNWGSHRGYAYDRASYLKAVGPATPVGELVAAFLLVPARRAYSAVVTDWSDPESYLIPAEVRLAAADAGFFDQGPLTPPRLQQAEDVAGGARPMAFLLRDTAHLQGYVLAGRCEWRNDGQPYQRSLAAFGKLIDAPQPTYPDLLWELASNAGLVSPARGGGPLVTKLKDPEPADLAALLLKAWLTDWPAAGFSRGKLVIGLRTRFLAAVQALPADTWLLQQSMEDWLAFTWPWWFGPDVEDEGKANRPPLWGFLRALGAGTGKTADGVEAVMISKAVQDLLAGERKAVVAALPPFEDTFTVQPDRTIVAPPNAHPSALLDLWQVADLESNQGAAVFRMTRDSVAAALNRGLTPEQVFHLLRERSRKPLPPTVEQVINDQAARYGQIKVGHASAFVKTEDPALLEQLVKDRKLQGIRWQVLAPGVAAVRAQDAAALLEALRKAGHLPVLLDDLPKEGAASNGTPPDGRATAAGTALQGRKRGRRSRLAALDNLVEQAISHGDLLSVEVDDDLGPREAVVEPLDIDEDFLYARMPQTEEEIEIELWSIRRATAAGKVEA